MLVDAKVNIRLKLSALWTAVMFCYIYGDYFELYVPGKIESLTTSKNTMDTPFKLFVVSFILAIPALMIFLSLMLRPIITKNLNIGVGLFFSLFTFLVGISSISEWRMFYVFLAMLETLITVIIVFQAWNWERLSPDS